MSSARIRFHSGSAFAPDDLSTRDTLGLASSSDLDAARGSCGIQRQDEALHRGAVPKLRDWVIEETTM